MNDHPFNRHQLHLVGRGNHSTFSNMEVTKEALKVGLKKLKDFLDGAQRNLKKSSKTFNVGFTTGYKSDAMGENEGFPTTMNITFLYNYNIQKRKLQILSAYPGSPYNGEGFKGKINRAG